MRIDSGSDVNWIRGHLSVLSHSHLPLGTQKTDFTLLNELDEYLVYFYAAARLDTLMDTNAGCNFNVAINVRFNLDSHRHIYVSIFCLHIFKFILFLYIS